MTNLVVNQYVHNQGNFVSFQAFCVSHDALDIFQCRVEE